MLDRLTDAVVRRRRWVIVIWVLLSGFGLFAANKVSDRWLEDFSIPGYAAYEANERAFTTLGSGSIEPYVTVFRTDGDITQVNGVKEAITAAAAATPGARVSSYFDSQSDAYVSPDRTTMFALIYPPGLSSFELALTDPTREALTKAAPTGVTANLTGVVPLFAEASEGQSGGPSILIEFLIGALGALVILFFTFGTLPAVAMPLVVAIASVLNTFTAIWVLTYITDVSVVVQFLVALVGLGVAIDYSLLMIFRFRDELRHGADRDAAIHATIRHAGHAVIVSGSTVAVGLLSMIIIPLPFIRSIGIGGMLIPLVSVLASLTLLPALLYILGPRINSLRVLPKRLVVGSDDPERGFWNRWSRMVMRRPVPIAAIGLAIVGVLVFFGLQMNPGDAQAKDFPGAGDAHDGYATLIASGITPGVLKPFQITVEGPGANGDLSTLARRVGDTPGVAAAVAPPQSRKGDLALVEAFATTDGSAKPTRETIKRLRNEVIPAAAGDVPAGTTLTVAGLPPQERDFVKAVYGTFPWVLLFVFVTTYILLARAFRSILLPLKAVLLNVVSLAAAFGVIVFIFQKGNGAEEIWNVAATDSIISWIPLMIFAFLFGLSMDYEVFMLSRMREAYDETGDTPTAVALGLARTGKLVTSAALVLMFSFLVLSSGPGTDIKQFGIGLAAGIILDATVIRALLVPAIMRLMGKWNWWLPKGAAKLLRVEPSGDRA